MENQEELIELSEETIKEIVIVNKLWNRHIKLHNTLFITSKISSIFVRLLITFPLAILLFLVSLMIKFFSHNSLRRAKKKVEPLIIRFVLEDNIIDLFELTELFDIEFLVISIERILKRNTALNNYILDDTKTKLILKES